MTSQDRPTTGSSTVHETAPDQNALSHKKRTVLFLCTGNACRSQMAEAMLRHLGDDRFESLSAGSQPAGFIHPIAIECMGIMGVSMEGQISKGWNDFLNTPVDVVITLCDSAAEQGCPSYPGTPVRAHWSLPDPTYHPGSPMQRVEFALRVAHRLRVKIAGLLEQDWSLPVAEIHARIQRLGEI